MLRNENVAHENGELNSGSDKDTLKPSGRTSPKLGLFEAANNEIEKTAAELDENLSSPVIFLVAYQPYVAQVGVDKFLGKEAANSDKVLKKYLEKFDVNTSNNVGMTLLHDLIWLQRFNLARLVFEHPNFTKINYKCCIPINMGVMYASALDLAIVMWLGRAEGIDLDFLEDMLKHGAKAPLPEKKFLDGEMVSVFYPLIMDKELDPEVRNAKDKSEEEPGEDILPRSQQELIDLFSLLNRYGFSINDLDTEFQKRLFNTKDDVDNRAAEFCEKFKISVEKQKLAFDDFISRLKEDAAKKYSEGKLVVEMNEARRDNGEKTLDLPFDPHYRPCCVM